MCNYRGPIPPDPERTCRKCTFWALCVESPEDITCAHLNGPSRPIENDGTCDLWDEIDWAIQNGYIEQRKKEIKELQNELDV